jgi:hypothetical protein
MFKAPGMSASPAACFAKTGSSRRTGGFAGASPLTGSGGRHSGTNQPDNSHLSPSSGLLRRAASRNDAVLGCHCELSEAISLARRQSIKVRFVPSGTLDVNITRTYTRAVPLERRRCRKLLPIRLIRPAVSCFSEAESRNLNDLILISSRHARGSAEGSSGNAEQIRRVCPPNPLSLARRASGTRFYSGMASSVSIFWLSRTTRRSMKR